MGVKLEGGRSFHDLLEVPCFRIARTARQGEVEADDVTDVTYLGRRESVLQFGGVNNVRGAPRCSFILHRRSV